MRKSKRKKIANNRISYNISEEAQFLNNKNINIAVFKIVVFSLVVVFSWFEFSGVGATSAYFNDTETSEDNIYLASDLDFSLGLVSNFTPSVTPTQSSKKEINTFNEGEMGFEYIIKAENFSGELCDYLDLSADLDGNGPEYFGSLTGFYYDLGVFSPPENWQFTSNLTTSSPDLENQTCTFDIVFDGEQIDGGGFNDQEVISNIITSGEWFVPPPEPCFVISEVYYDPDEAHQGNPQEEMFEWVELYNACDEIINLKDWYISDSVGSEIIHQTYWIEPGQFVVLAPNAAVWNTYWSLIPTNAVKISLGGTMISDGLGNEEDRVVLHSSDHSEVDAVSWGTNTFIFDPPLPAVAEGHSIARKNKSIDTNTADDWEDSDTPTPGR